MTHPPVRHRSTCRANRPSRSRRSHPTKGRNSARPRTGPRSGICPCPRGAAVRCRCALPELARPGKARHLPGTAHAPARRGTSTPTEAVTLDSDGGRRLYEQGDELRAAGPAVRVRLPRTSSPGRSPAETSPSNSSSPHVSKDARKSWPFTSDHGDRTRLRQLLGRAFTPRRIAAMRPAIEVVVTDLLDVLADRGADERVDLRAEFAHGVPTRVICDPFGVPADQRPRCSASWAPCSPPTSRPSSPRPWATTSTAGCEPSSRPSASLPPAAPPADQGPERPAGHLDATAGRASLEPGGEAYGDA
jgi:hypothetical protein